MIYPDFTYKSLLALLFTSVILPASINAQSHEHEGASPPPDPLQDIVQAFDVLHYDAKLNFSEAPSKEMSGICDIELTWIDDPSDDPFYFHLRDLTIDSAFYNGELVTVRTVGSPDDMAYHHEIEAPSSAGIMDTAVITIHYSGTMTDEFGSGFWGGVSSRNGVLFAMGVGFLNNYVSTTQHWLPCYDHPSDKATFRGEFLVPSEMNVASNGLVQQLPAPAGFSSYVWTHDIPCATYLLTFATAPYVVIDMGDDPVPMVLYTLPADSSATAQTFSLLPRMVSTYSNLFGTYPFEKVGYVNTPIGAMEHQTMVSFPTSLSRRGDSLNIVGAHELAHQWFGDLVSPVDFRHAWLNESFATFCESIWMEEIGGNSAYLASLNGDMSQYFNSIVRNEGVLPLYNFSRTPPSSNYPQTIYRKGSVVVGMLRYEMGDEDFFEAMRTFLSRYAFGNASTDDLLNVCEEVSGKELNWFFDQWVHRSGWPELRITVVAYPQNRTVTVFTEQIQSEDVGLFTNVPVEISLTLSTGTHHEVIVIDQKQQEFAINIDVDDREIIASTANQGPTLRTLAQIEFDHLTDVHEEVQQENEIRFIVAPNPSLGSDEQQIIVENGSISTLDYTLYDTSGHVVTMGSWSHPPFNLPTSDLPSGHYLIRVFGKDVMRDLPLIIEK